MPGRIDPYRNFRFLVQFSETGQAGFSEVIIGETCADLIEYREGGKAQAVRKLQGHINYGNIILKRGMTGSMQLYQWWESVENGNTKRMNVSIDILDEKGQGAARWEIISAWPVKYQPSALSALGNQVEIEMIELANEGIKRVS